MSLNIKLINLLYIFSRILGLSPVKFRIVPPNATYLNVLFLIVYLIVLNGAIFCLELLFFSYLFYREHVKHTVFRSKGMQACIYMANILSAPYLHLLNRNRIVHLIHEAFQIRQYMIDTDTTGKLKIDFFDKKCSWIREIKCVVLVVQVIMVAYTLVLTTHFFRGQDPVELYMMLVKQIIRDMFLYTITSQYFVAMLLALQFYRHINGSVTRTMKSIQTIYRSSKNSMKMQLYCEKSDDLDHLAKLYNRCTAYTENANKIFSIMILLYTTFSFVIPLVVVSFKTLLFYSFYYIVILALLYLL